MQNVVMLTFISAEWIMLSVASKLYNLSVVMLNVITLMVIMLNVAARY
jgi:hypothetical protein